VDGKNTVIVDDFTISCGTLADTANALKKNGARKIFACVSHGVLSDSGLELLENSSIEKLIMTDTVNNGKVLAHNKIEVVSVAGLFARAIENIHKGESLSELFK